MKMMQFSMMQYRKLFQVLLEESERKVIKVKAIVIVKLQNTLVSKYISLT